MEHGPGPEGEDPSTEDPEEERYDELDDLADDTRDELDISITTEDIKATSTALAAMETKGYIARADSITTRADIATTEDFGDDTGTDDYTPLVEKAKEVMNGDPLRRSQAREEFLAVALGYTDPNRTSASADTMLSLVSMNLAGELPTGLDPSTVKTVKALSDAWRDSKASIFYRLAERYALEDVAALDLDRHMHFMSMVADLRVTDHERLFLWDNPAEMVDLVEEVIAGMIPGEPVDLSVLYARLGVLTADPTHPLYISQAAEVARLALGVLAIDRTPVAVNPPEKQTATILKNISTHLDAANDSLEKLGQGKVGLGGRLDPRAKVLSKGDYDLGQTWDYLYNLRRATLPATGAGKQRGTALDNAFGDLADKLTALSVARRTGAPEDVAAKATDVWNALADAEKNLRQLLGDPTKVDATKDIEVDMTKLMMLFRGRVAEICRDAAAGKVSTTTVLDLAIAVAEGQLTPYGSPLRQLPKPVRILATFVHVIEDVKALGSNSDVKAFRDALAKWTDAADGRRTTAETRPNPKTGETVDWPGLGDATTQLLDALKIVRASTAGAPDSPRLNAALDEVLSRVIDALRSDAWVKDTRLAAIDPAGLAGQVEALLQPPILTDPAAGWQAKKKELQAAAKDGPTFKEGLGAALKKFSRAAVATPVDTTKLASRSLEVLTILSDYRSAVRNTVKDPNILVQYHIIFNQIALTVATTLRGIKV